MGTYRGFRFENVVFPAASLPKIIEHYGPRYLDQTEDRRGISKTDTVIEILDAIADSAGHNDDDVKANVTATGDLTYQWSRGTEQIDYTTTEDLEALVDFAAPGASLTMIDEQFEGGEYVKVKGDDGSTQGHAPQLHYPGLSSSHLVNASPEQLRAVIEFAERGISRELGAIDPRHPYTEQELADTKTRFENARAGLAALAGALQEGASA